MADSINVKISEPYISLQISSPVTTAPETTALATRSEEEVIAALKHARLTTHCNSSQSQAFITRLSARSTLEQPGPPINAPKDSEENEPDHEEFSEDEQVITPNERKISQKKQILDNIHRSYVEEKLRIAKNPLQAKAPDGNESTKWLVKQSESQRIISTPREYQLELFEKAKTENVIAVLDTGSGKTLIAVLLLRHVIEQELVDREMGKSKRISFFLVNSVALAFQQYAVLDANLDYSMERFCGSKVTDHGSKSMWDKVFVENMVIVCTAEVLNHCLHRSFISMDRINLLIFDEAHHAKKNHPFARIIKDFYVQEENKTRRPKIFGMTASPVDATVDVRKAAIELETILHCRIATASDVTVARYHSDNRQELIAEYPALLLPFKTPLYQEMEAKFKNVKVLRKPFFFAHIATAELGAWCADHMWWHCMTEEEAKKLKAKTETKFLLQKTTGMAEYEAQVYKIEEARKIIRSHDFSPPQPNMDQMSPKVICLMDYLKDRFERQTDDKCIVFVEKRYTARLLTDLFDHPNIGTKHLRVGSLIGIQAGDAGDMKVSLREQVLILKKFREGRINCLFATSVAEEGLDIPDCNLIIRFDLYRTVTQYIQSRGRARHANSRYIHMKETNNRAHAALIREVQKNENVLREFCRALPEDRLLKGNDFDMNVFLLQEKRHLVYVEPATGAKLTYRMSLVVLANFVGSLPQSSEGSLNAEYVMTTQGQMFVFEVILPDTSPVHGAVGRPHSTKQVAKCAAAFEACLALRRGNYINQYLQSTYTRKIPAMRDALLAISSKKRGSYTMRTKPSIWTTHEIPTLLYMTVLVLSDTEVVSRPIQPIAILTRTILPEIPQFPLFFGGGLKSQVMSTIYAEPIHVNEKLVAIIDSFTLRIFNDVFSKEYKSNVSRMAYFLVPIKSDYQQINKSPIDLIDWNILNTVQDNFSLSWDENTPEQFFEDRFLVDRWDGSRKLWAVNVTHEYKPLDAVPPNTAPRPRTWKNNENIMEYSISLCAKSRARYAFGSVQPVIRAEYIPLRRNMLDDRDENTESELPRKCFVIPEPFIISALPTTVVAMAYLFPAIIHRIESYLIALEACDILHIKVPADLALEAMTKDSDSSEEHGGEHVQFHRGMGKNYERLEFLGDCFLKMATSIAIYTLYPESNEYEYHVKRMLLLCNKNLFGNACSLHLYEYIRSKSFNRRAWYPEGLELLKGKAASAPKQHRLSDKTIADVCEALIGASLLATRVTGEMDNAVRAVTELVCSIDHTMTTFADYKKQYRMPKYQTDSSTSGQRELARKTEQEHPYHFNYPRLLRSAFVHPSYPFSYEHVPNYQRLEFLGDALLDMTCINFLYHAYPEHSPQWLTEHKMAMVSNQFLGAICVELGFHKHLLTFSSVIQNLIAEYVIAITDARVQAEAEAEATGKPRSSYARDFWVNTKQPPKCLPDIIEAYIGAIFIDSDYNYSTVENFFNMHVRTYFEDMYIYDTFANKHPVTHLHKLMNQLGCLSWKLHSTEMPDLGDGFPRRSVATIMVHGVVIVGQDGESGRNAKMNVAKKALSMLKGLPLPEFRVSYRCDCKMDDEGEDVKIANEIGHGTAV